MGRPRALKSKDVVPTIKIDTKNTKKHKKFDEEVTADELEGTFTIEDEPKKRVTASADDDDDNAPEEIIQDEIQIKALKEEVENLFSVQKEAKRRRKFNKEVVVEENSEDEYLDQRDLMKVTSAKESKKDSSEYSVASNQEDANSDEESRVVGVGMKRKIGKLEVAVIANASIDDFRINSDAEKFLSQHRSKAPRTRYTTFTSQRRPAPAKVFLAKTSKK